MASFRQSLGRMREAPLASRPDLLFEPLGWASGLEKSREEVTQCKQQLLTSVLWKMRAAVALLAISGLVFLLC